MDRTGVALAPNVMVGRDAQLEVVDLLLDDLGTGRPGVLLLAGDAGIGKTRLADELVTRAKARGWRAAWVGAWHGDGVPPLWPWAVLLRQMVGPGDLVDQISTGVAADAEGGLDPGRAASARFAQFESIANALRDAIGGRPVVAVVDDLHWADPASIQLATFCAAALRDEPLLLVLTFRPLEMNPADLASLTRVGLTMQMPPLPTGAVGELLAQSIGRAVDAPVVAAIAERSGGNPLFVQEYGRLLAVSGRTRIAPVGIPDGVAAVIERRLARLPEWTIAVLQVAAVIGQRLTVEAAAEVADRNWVQVSDELAPAVATGILVRDVDGYVFGHDLIREVVLDAMGAERRSALHLLAAEHLQRRLGTDPMLHAGVADHLTYAGPGHAAEAARHWVAAAGQAAGRLAYEEAAACFRRARMLDGSDPSLACCWLLEEGSALMRAGRLVEGRACFDEAAGLARIVERFDLLAEAALGLGVGDSGWEVPIWNAHQIELVREALDALPPTERRLRSTLLARLSVAAAVPDALESSRALAEEALALAADEGDPRLMAQALASLCDSMGSPEHAECRAAHARTIIELGAAAHDRVLELLGRRFLVVALLELGRFVDLDREIALFERLARQVNQPLLVWYAPLFRGMRALLAGDLEESQRCQQVVADAAAATQSENADMLASTLQMGIDTALGRPTSGEFMLRFDIDPRVWASYCAGLAFVAVRRGDHVEAARLLRMHANDGFAHVGRDAEHLATMMYFTRVAVALDDHVALTAAAALLEPHAGKWIVDGIAAVCWGPVDLELARIAAAVGDGNAFERHRVAAAALVADADAPLLATDLASFRVRAAKVGDRLIPPTAAEDLTDLHVLRCDGEYWTVVFDGRTASMRDARGLHDLRVLLARPGTEVHVLELAGDPAGKVRAQGDLGDVIDGRARAEYTRRLRDLQEDIEEARDANDLARAERLESERDFLAAELGAALGLGGRVRRAGGDVERARKAVGARIRLTIERMEPIHPSLARHLRNALRTGVFCSYRPEHPTRWSVG